MICRSLLQLLKFIAKRNQPHQLLASSTYAISSLVSPTASYYLSLIQSSSSLSHLRQLHGRLLRTFLYDNVVLTSSLVLAYSRKNRLEADALSLFYHMPCRNIYSWNIIVAEYSRAGLDVEAVELFRFMWEACPEGVRPDDYCLPHVLRACTYSTAFGLLMHGMCAKLGFAQSLFVGSALVNMYIKMGFAGSANKVFEEMPKRDAVLWTAILAGYAQHEQPELGLIMYREMICDKVELDWVVMVSLLSIIGQMTMLKEGKSIHAWCVHHCSPWMDIKLNNAIVDLYVKCSSLSYAQRWFDRMQERDVISCSSLMLGYGLSGHVSEAVKLYHLMREKGINPSDVTFLGLLSAFGHAGMVEEARLYFETMKAEFGMVPGKKHYATMVNCLAKAGHVEEAERLVDEMAGEADGAVLGALLLGCRDHSNVEVGERVAMKLISMEPNNAGYYILLANMYAHTRRFHDAQRIRDMMKLRNVWKMPGCSMPHASSSN